MSYTRRGRCDFSQSSARGDGIARLQAEGSGVDDQIHRITRQTLDYLDSREAGGDCGGQLRGPGRGSIHQEQAANAFLRQLQGRGPGRPARAQKKNGGRRASLPAIGNLP